MGQNILSDIKKYAGYQKDRSCECNAEYKFIYKIRHDLTKMNNMIVNFAFELVKTGTFVNLYQRVRSYKGKKNPMESICTLTHGCV